MNLYRIVGNKVEPLLGQVMTAHGENNCVAPCTIHAPSQHHMESWSLIWRDDRAMFERRCPHGIGHPDPDQISFWKLRVVKHEWDVEDFDAMCLHGCDGCCHEQVRWNYGDDDQVGLSDNRG